MIDWFRLITVDDGSDYDGDDAHDDDDEDDDDDSVNVRDG